MKVQTSITIPINATLHKLQRPKNTLYNIPLIKKTRFKSINHVGKTVKEFVPMVEHERLVEMSDDRPIIKFSSHRSKSFRTRAPVFRKISSTKAGFSVEDLNIISQVGDASAKSLALATMERVFNLDAKLKDAKTPFSYLSPNEQDEAKMYLAELKSSLVEIQNSKGTSLQIQELTKKAIDNYVRKLRGIIKNKEAVPGWSDLIESYNTFASQVSSVSDLIISGNDTIATVADGMVPDPPDRAISKMVDKIAVVSTPSNRFVLKRSSYVNLFELLHDSKYKDALYKKFANTNGLDKKTIRVDPFIRSLKLTSAGMLALQNIASIILTEEIKLNKIHPDEATKQYIAEFKTLGANPGTKFIDEYKLAHVGGAPIVRIAPPPHGSYAVNALTGLEEYNDIKSFNDISPHFSNVITDLESKHPGLTASTINGTSFQDEAVNQYKTFVGRPVVPVQDAKDYKAALDPYVADYDASLSAPVLASATVSDGDEWPVLPSPATIKDIPEPLQSALLKYVKSNPGLGGFQDGKTTFENEVVQEYINRYQGTDATLQPDDDVVQFIIDIDALPITGVFKSRSITSTMYDPATKPQSMIDIITRWTALHPRIEQHVDPTNQNDYQTTIDSVYRLNFAGQPVDSANDEKKFINAIEATNFFTSYTHPSSSGTSPHGFTENDFKSVNATSLQNFIKKLFSHDSKYQKAIEDVGLVTSKGSINFAKNVRDKHINILLTSTEAEPYMILVKKIMDTTQVNFETALAQLGTVSRFPLTGFGRKMASKKPAKKTISKNKLIEIAKILKKYA